MSEIYNPPDNFSSKALISSLDEYKKKYRLSLDNPDLFWAQEAEQFTWFKKWEVVRQFNYDVRNGKIYIEWFKGGKTNITMNCIDRHLETRGEQIAILWEGNEPGENHSLTYNQLYADVCRFSNVLKKYGVHKGDRVSIYMPMVPELAIAMLA
ncbi:uncharacterized protein METZ01_LOCUS304100, partial [marine metagenome]